MIGPVWADRLLDRALPSGPTGDAIRGDLRQERARRSRERGEGAARRWYARQALSVWLWATRDRILGRGWRSGHRLDRGPGADVRWELREAVRVLLRSPAYSGAVVLTLGVAMAATVSVFTVVRGALLHDLPWPDGDELVRIDAVRDRAPRDGGISHPTFLGLADGLSTMDGLGAYQGAEGVWIGDGVTEVWRGIAVSHDLLAVIGTEPLLGALYGPDEGAIGEMSIYLSHDLWERRFGADPGIVGRTIQLSEQSWLVRGVMPRGFDFPTPDIDYWIPIRDSRYLTSRASAILRVVGRLADGVTLEAARAELAAVNPALSSEPDRADPEVMVRRLVDVARAPVARALWIFQGAVAFFLLIACANVAALALARTEGRRNELAVRLSLGANRARVARQAVLESTVLAIVGGAVGLLGALAGVRALLTLAPAELPRRDAITVDPVVVLTALAVSLLVGILFGALPGVRAARVAATKPRGSRGADRGTRRTHRLLAAAQVGVAVVLLFGAGLLLRSFSALTSVDTGLATADDLLLVELGLAPAEYSDRDAVVAFHRRLMDGLAELPSVESVALSTHLPFSGSQIQVTMVREGEPYRADRAPVVGVEMVGGDYRAALGLPLLRGRDPRRDPSAQEPIREILVNESAADLLWPGQDPLGRKLSFDIEEGRIPEPGTYHTVVGVVPDVRDGTLDQAPRPRAYYEISDFRRLYGFVSGRYFFTLIRTNGDIGGTLERARSLVRSLDPRLPVRSTSTLAQRIRDTTVPARFRTVTLTVFAALAVLVALLGVYAVMAYGVATGARDIGVRMALGARAAAVRTRVLGEALAVVGVGAALGGGAAFALAPVLRSMLYEVSERDPATLAGVVALAVVGALGAAYLPARRATRVDPMSILREE